MSKSGDLCLPGMVTRKVHTLVIGSGAAGLAAAVRLQALGISDLVVYSEGLRMGTSINTGSDKQTYYKLGMYGDEPDSPLAMARDLAAGGAMHGDIALVEAALSQQTFAGLVNLGVPFPHDAFGQYIGYKTDHDPKRRATSCGPYTSREMCLALTAELQRRKIEVQERQLAIKVLTDAARERCLGAVFLSLQDGEPQFSAVQAENVVFAVGGPGGLYATSVYPAVHCGGIGLGLEAGALAANLAESQFGLASVKFRWNVSGSYMQVLPRFISRNEQGEEREFLREYFDSPAAMYDAIFLKGYQWPFAAGNVPGSSLVDIFVYIETVERGNRVFLDYRQDPPDLQFTKLAAETREYLEKSRAWGTSPLQRLQALNAPAIELYRTHGIDLSKESLEIAVCAQHNNGGLAGNIWWESRNLRHFFPIGEVNGSHGVTRPGGSALNAGQVGAYRAAEYIARKYQGSSDTEAEFQQALANCWQDWQERLTVTAPADKAWRVERQALQQRMSRAGAFVRVWEQVRTALDETVRQYEQSLRTPLGGMSGREVAETLRNQQLCLAAVFYLQCILVQTEQVGSRGGALVLSGGGERLHPALSEKWCIMPEDPSCRKRVMLCAADAAGQPQVSWEDCRPLPQTDGWFETVWSEFRQGAVFDQF
ncbi:MAG: FAD-binding protein [Lentisphaerae bacterium]|nr:FAD-binding protein [Lentisphaerota bacterium]